MAMRGLQVFISDIRAARSREEEEKRVNKEKGNIIAKFKDGKLSSYDKKKYVCKLLYMYMLGWDVDFGHVEAVKLITGNTYTEKQIGYLAVTLLLSEQSELVRIVVNSIRQDLTSGNEIFVCLALTAVANVGGREMSEALYADVQKLLFSSNSKNFVRKKAALCLLRLYRKNPEVLPGGDWADRILNLMDDSDQGVVTSVISLVLALVQDFPNEYQGCISKAISRLSKIASSEVSGDYEYYRVLNPWLQVKLLRLLQYYPPPNDASTRQQLDRVLYSLITKAASGPTDTSKGFNYSNATNAVVLEALNLAIHIDPNSDMLQRGTALLGSFISHKESNLRYLGLGTMATLAAVVESLDSIKRHTDTILQALRDRDISVRRQALDLLYTMCDSTNSKRIVAELLTYLGIADYAIREEMVLKIAILAERFATEYSWYVDVILQLISVAGDHVSEEVWYRVVQIVTNHPDLQPYAARTAMKALNSPTWHETAVKVAGYILGEFGDYIANEPESTPIDQFRALHSKFPACTLQTRALLLSTYIKLLNLFPEIREEVEGVFRSYASVLDVEVQQRAAEYLAIANAPAQLLELVCEEMPPFEEKSESALVSLVNKKEGETTDKRVRPRDRDQTQRNGKERSRTQLTNFSSSSSSSSSASKQPEPAVRLSSKAPPINQSPSSQTPAPRRPSNDVDLLGGGSAKASSASPAPTAALEDLLGLGTATTSASTPAQQQGLTPGSERWLLPLLVRNDGVLFEDNEIQIGLKAEYQGARGRIALYFGNKSPSFPLSNFSATVQSINGLTFQTQQAAPAVIAPVAQSVQIILVSCETEFADAPLLSVSFQHSSTRRLTIRLPITPARFVVPVQLNATDFFARWKQIGGNEREVVKDFRPAGGINLDSIRQVLTAFQFGVLDGVDPIANNFVAAGIFSPGSGPKAGLLARLQTNVPSENMIRLTVRSTSPPVANAITTYLTMRLSA